MKRWPIKPLGELLTIQNGFAFKSELFNDEGKGLPIIRIRDLARGFSETFYNGKHDSGFEVENGDFLIGMDGEFRCYRWQGGKALLNQRVCRLQNFNRNLDASYVFYGINEHLRTIEDSTAFVTVKHLSSKQIANIEMGVPPLAEQQRIVKLLDEADVLRQLRTQADTRTAHLLPALFHEMFGDPVTNSKGFPNAALGELASVERGKFTPRPRNDPSYFGGDHPFIQTGDIANSNGWLTRHSQSLNEKGKSVSKEFPAGAIVIAIVGATIGQTAILGIPVFATDSVVAIQPNCERVVAAYVHNVLKFWRPVFLAQAPET